MYHAIGRYQSLLFGDSGGWSCRKMGFNDSETELIEIFDGDECDFRVYVIRVNALNESDRGYRRHQVIVWIRSFP